MNEMLGAEEPEPLESETLEPKPWRRLRSWLTPDVEEWEPKTAAYLLVGLDPEETEPASGGQGWYFAWLPSYPADGGNGDPYSLARNTEAALKRMLGLTAAASPLEQRTPREWVTWAEKEGLTLTWLAEAREKPDLSEVLGVPKSRRQALAIPEQKIKATLEIHQINAVAERGYPDKRDIAVKACVAELRCTRKAAQSALRELPLVLRYKQGAPRKAAKRP
jgi:hypothetical protein